MQPMERYDARERVARVIRMKKMRWGVHVCAAVVVMTLYAACVDGVQPSPRSRDETHISPNVHTVARDVISEDELTLACSGANLVTECVDVSVVTSVPPNSAIVTPVTIRFSRPVSMVYLTLIEQAPYECIDDRLVPTVCHTRRALASAAVQARDTAGQEVAAVSLTPEDDGVVTVRGLVATISSITITPVLTPGATYTYAFAWELLATHVPAPHPTVTTASVVVTTAEGPNANGSFLSGATESRIRLAATPTPGTLTPVQWTMRDDPDDAVTTQPPSSIPDGPTSFTSIPPQPSTRWQSVPHPGTLAQKSLSVLVEASVTHEGQVVKSKPVRVRQSEWDTIRQEYRDFGLALPPATAMQSADRTTLSPRLFQRLNQGDYRIAVVEPELARRLAALERTIGPLAITSGFRNPVHHRFHVSRKRGQRAARASNHQYGLAIDLATASRSTTWMRIRNAAIAQGFCVEPFELSSVNHVHADWRGHPNTCPKGW